MDNIANSLTIFSDDLGPAWLVGAGTILLASILLRTWTLLAFLTGIILTLHFHPNQSPSRPQVDPKRFFETKYDEQELVHDNGQDLSNDGDLSQQIPPLLRQEMKSFSDQVIVNYVKWWYQPPNFPEDDLFPQACRKSLNHILNRLYTSFSRKDPVLYFDAIFTNLVATLGAVLDDLRVANKARAQHDKTGLRQFAKTSPNAIVTRMMNKQERNENLRRAANIFVSNFVSSSDLECLPASEFLRQLISSTIFEASLLSLAHHDVLNQFLVNTLSRKQSAGQTVSDSSQHLAAALDLATQQAASVSQTSINDNVLPPAVVPLSHSVTEDNSPMEDSFEITEPTNRSARGRRLSFKNKSLGSIADFHDEDGSQSTDKRLSFLKRTGSLLSRSRSRSTSPSKSIDLGHSYSHNRSRSTSPLKKPVLQDPPQVALYRAEIIVNDASDIKAADFTSYIKAMPKFSILISPVKQEGFVSAGGIGIFRSMRDVLDLDRLLRHTTSTQSGHLPTLPDLKSSTYASLEVDMLAYLLAIVRDQALSTSVPFKQFCRPDLMSDDSSEPVHEFKDSPSSSHKSFFSGLRPNIELASGNPDPLKSEPNKKAKEQPMDDTEELRTLLALKNERNAALHNKTNDGLPETNRPLEHTRNNDACKQFDQTQATIDYSRLDLQNLVSQGMELLTTFYALSSRTWTIRKQLLNVLRNLLLSKNSVYTQAFMDYLEHSVLTPISSANHMARHLRDFNKFMFPADYIAPKILSVSESQALAVEARALFVAKGMPSAIRNLMGSPPTAEALGILFDALQDPDFSLGLVSILFTETFKTMMVD